MKPRPPRQPLSLSVVLPCYNEEANVERVALAALAMARRVAPADHEIIVVNDGSRDRTAQIAEALSRTHPSIRVVHNQPNQGYGGALQSGFRAARKAWVFYTDGDGQFDVEEIDKLLPLLEHADIVSGYRTRRRDPLHRRINGWGWTFLTNRVLGLRMRDVDSAFKIYPRHLFETISMWSRSALIDAEILAKAQRAGYRVAEVGVRHLPRVAGAQTGAKLSSILRALRELFTLWRRIRAEHADRP
ncbi:MAG: glycosyltransferase family 2 protein [Phycisphaerae bacterium]